MMIQAITKVHVIFYKSCLGCTRTIVQPLKKRWKQGCFIGVVVYSPLEITINTMNQSIPKSCLHQHLRPLSRERRLRIQSVYQVQNSRRPTSAREWSGVLDQNAQLAHFHVLDFDLFGLTWRWCRGRVLSDSEVRCPAPSGQSFSDRYLSVVR